jgi:hypothetical protein
VKLIKPQSVETFMDALETLRKDRKKAENVLLDDIENDIARKEQFITEQVRTLSEMQGNKNTLIEHRSVLQVSLQVINGAFGEGHQPGADEERKEEIQMEDLARRQPGEGGLSSPGVQTES